LIFVHLPNIVVFDREEDEAVGVLFKKRLFVDESLTLGDSL
jgi:hypothetical protein